MAPYSFFNILELGLLKIFNHFIKVSEIINNVPAILKPIAEDIVDDVRKLIPEVETLASKYNVTEPLLAEVGKALDMKRVVDEIIPELEKVRGMLLKSLTFASKTENTRRKNGQLHQCCSCMKRIYKFSIVYFVKKSPNRQDV